MVLPPDVKDVSLESGIWNLRASTIWKLEFGAGRQIARFPDSQMP
jgi:hypothetical protein